MTNERKAELFENIMDYLSEHVDDEDEMIRVLLKIEFTADEVNDELWLREDEQVVCLCTFPFSDCFYCRTFYVRKGWLHERIVLGAPVEKFLEEYTWDETWVIYQAAKADYRILYEENQL